MAKQVQWRKGTTAQHKSFVGANCEITVDTTKKTLVVHDGITPGGSVQATEKYVNDAVATIDVSSYPSKDYVDTLNGKNVKLTGNQTIADVKTFSSNIVGNITGNSATATKLQTARNIALTGDVTGNGNFDGTGNLSIATTIAGNAPSATKLATAIKINGVTFDGSANITVSDDTAVKLTGDQTIKGVKTFTSSPVVPTPTTENQVANKNYVDVSISNLDVGVPRGAIIMWSGAISTIPINWALCDGTNGTPDLRNRFVVCAGSIYGVGETGGSKDAIVVEHTHTGTAASGGSGGTFINDVIYNTPASGYTSLGDYVLSSNAGDKRLQKRSASISAHTHALTLNSTGSSGTNANLPPYFALAYIMKL